MKTRSSKSFAPAEQGEVEPMERPVVTAQPTLKVARGFAARFAREVPTVPTGLLWRAQS